MKKEKLLNLVGIIEDLDNMYKESKDKVDYKVLNCISEAKQKACHRLDELAIRQLMKDCDIPYSSKTYRIIAHELEEGNYHHPAEAYLQLGYDIWEPSLHWEINADKKKYIKFIKTVYHEYVVNI